MDRAPAIQIESAKDTGNVKYAALGIGGIMLSAPLRRLVDMVISGPRNDQNFLGQSVVYYFPDRLLKKTSENALAFLTTI